MRTRNSYGCRTQGPPSALSTPSCRWVPEGRIGDAFLLGDSNSGQFSEPFVAAMNGQGYSATIANGSGCPFIDLTLVVDGDEYAA